MISLFSLLGRSLDVLNLTSYGSNFWMTLDPVSAAKNDGSGSPRGSQSHTRACIVPEQAPGNDIHERARKIVEDASGLFERGIKLR
jgi:hypothetical protein